MALFGRETPADQERAEAWARWAAERNPLAMASLVLGVFSLLEAGIIPIVSTTGLVLGIISLRQMNRPGEVRRLGHRLAWTGIVLSSVALVVGTSLYIHSYLIHR